MRVLVLEDEHAIRVPLVRAVRKWGHEVRGVGSLAEARQTVAEWPPEALLSDLKLPDGSGLDFACECGAPFILMSGYASFDDAVVALRHGCVDFLTKPVAMQVVREALSRLGARRADGPPPLRRGEGEGQQVVLEGDRFQHQQVVIHDRTWQEPAATQQHFADLVAGCPGAAARLVLATFLTAEQGTLVVNQAPGRWWCWSDAALDGDGRAMVESSCERTWVRGDGWLCEVPVRDDEPHVVGRADPANGEGVAAWSGELLRPVPLSSARILDWTRLTALGTWALPWLRGRPGQAVVGAQASLKRRLQAAKLPVLWYANEREVPVVGEVAPGLTPGERDLLWGTSDG